VKQDLQERTTRWRQIETLCNVPIAINPGLNYLETLLRSGAINSSRYVVLNSPSRHGTTFEEDPDETSSVVSSSAGNGSSASVSLSELPRASGSSANRPRLNQRENSKDSAFDGSVASSSGHCPVDDDASESKPRTAVSTVGSAHPKVDHKALNPETVARSSASFTKVDVRHRMSTLTMNKSFSQDCPDVAAPLTKVLS